MLADAPTRFGVVSGWDVETGFDGPVGPSHPKEEENSPRTMQLIERNDICKSYLTQLQDENIRQLRIWDETAKIKDKLVKYKARKLSTVKVIARKWIHRYTHISFIHPLIATFYKWRFSFKLTAGYTNRLAWGAAMWPEHAQLMGLAFNALQIYATLCSMRKSVILAGLRPLPRGMEHLGRTFVEPMFDASDSKPRKGVPNQAVSAYIDAPTVMVTAGRVIKDQGALVRGATAPAELSANVREPSRQQLKEFTFPTSEFHARGYFQLWRVAAYLSRTEGILEPGDDDVIYPEDIERKRRAQRREALLKAPKPKRGKQVDSKEKGRLRRMKTRPKVRRVFDEEDEGEDNDDADGQEPPTDKTDKTRSRRGRDKGSKDAEPTEPNSPTEADRKKRYTMVYHGTHDLDPMQSAKKRYKTPKESDEAKVLRRRRSAVIDERHAALLAGLELPGREAPDTVRRERAIPYFHLSYGRGGNAMFLYERGFVAWKHYTREGKAKDSTVSSQEQKYVSALTRECFQAWYYEAMEWALIDKKVERRGHKPIVNAALIEWSMYQFVCFREDKWRRMLAAADQDLNRVKDFYEKQVSSLENELIRISRSHSAGPTIVAAHAPELNLHSLFE
jgi:hypothetical protein